MKRELIFTEDGSNSIYMPEMKENYHSKHGAIQEARHVFIENGLKQIQSNIIRVFEVGFGTGLNAFLSLEYARSNSIYLEYDTIEAFPVEEEIILELNYAQKTGLSRNDFLKLHSVDWGTNNEMDEFFKLYKIKSKVQAVELKSNQYDIVFFDAFGPRAQNEMWSTEILLKMFNAIKKNGLFVTYCAQGQFKRDLKEVGFKVTVAPGPPGKREMTIGVKE